VVGMILAVYYFKYGIIGKIIGRPKHFPQIVKDHILALVDQGVLMDVSIDSRGNFIRGLNYDISTVVGHHHILRFYDPALKRTRIMLYDIDANFSRGEIIGDKIHPNSSDALRQLIALVEQIEKGVTAKSYITPTLVREVIERTQASPESEK